MNPWIARPVEERGLLSPSFFSCLLWHASLGYWGVAALPIPFEISFLVLPMVLHRETREALPKTISTSLAVWIGDNPLSRSHVAVRARTLAPFTKEAMMFGGIHGLFDMTGGPITANTSWKKRITTEMKTSTDEVRTCFKRAEFIGRWFASAGSAETVIAILGVRP